MTHLRWTDNFRGETWDEVLKKWEKGYIPSIPFSVSKPFTWKTSCIDKEQKNFYLEEFKEDKRLKNLKQDLETFKDAFDLFNKDKHCVAKPNLGKDSIMVVPTADKNKQYPSLFLFMETASEEKQKALWKLVAKETKKMLKKFDRVWINSNCLGVHYLHVRIDTKPKYYEESELAQIIDNKKVIKQYNLYLKEKSS